METKNIVKRTSYLNNIIPDLDYKDIQDYIIFMFNCSYAELISKNKQEVMEYIDNNKLDIMRIEIERNYYGLNDFKIIVRRK